MANTGIFANGRSVRVKVTIDGLATAAFDQSMVDGNSFTFVGGNAGYSYTISVAGGVATLVSNSANPTGPIGRIEFFPGGILSKASYLYWSAPGSSSSQYYVDGVGHSAIYSGPDLNPEPTVSFGGQSVFFSGTTAGHTVLILQPLATVAYLTAPNDAITVGVNLSATDSPVITLGGLPVTPDSLTIVTSPTNGTASVSGKKLLYTPNAGYCGPDSLTYTATFNGSVSNVATLSISVVHYRSSVFVYTIPAVGAKGTWSRYDFPFQIDQFTVMDDVLYIRSGDDVLFYDPTTSNDYNADTAVPSRSVPFPGIVQTPWLDMGNPGINKMVTGFDFVSTGGPPSVSFGYDQSNFGLYTAPFVIPADTVPGQIIPMPICAPSLSMKVTYAGGAPWQIQAMNIYVQDERETA